MDNIRPDIYQKAMTFTDQEKWLFRIRWHGPQKDKRSYHFTPCRRTTIFGIDKPDSGPDINKGWIKDQGSLFQPALFNEVPVDIKGFRIIEDTLFIQEENGNLQKVITVPKDIKTASREKWLKSVTYTLTTDPDNLIQYRMRTPEDIPEYEYIKCCEEIAA